MTEAIANPPRWSQWKVKVSQAQWLLLGGLVYYAAARMGMALFSLHPSNITLLWLPAGVGLAMCMAARWQQALPFIFLASFAANAPGMALESTALHVAHTIVAAGADTLAAWLASMMMRRYVPEGLSRLTSLFTFIVYVCVVPTLVSGLILGVNLAVGGYISWSAVTPLVGKFLFADSLGILLVYPLFDAWRKRVPMSAIEWRNWALLTLVPLAMVYWAFHQLSGLIFLVIPVLLYLVFHGRALGMHLTLAFTIGMVVALAAHDLGPFRLQSEEQAHFMLLGYLFTTTIVTLGMGLQQLDLANANRAQQDWQFRANHDSLTGLYNRLAFSPLMKNEIERARRTQRVFSVAMIDIDHFKRVNDTYGHPVGDQVLVALSSRLHALLRTMDVAARFGGEEFAILFPETPMAEALQAMERLRASIESQPLLNGLQTISVTISGGLAEWHADHSIGVDEVLAIADLRLYEAKRGGRNQIVYG